MARFAVTHFVAAGVMVINASEAAKNASIASSDIDAPGQSAVQRLFNTLFVTFTTVFLGYAVVRLKLIAMEDGEMRGLGFFIGNIVFPVLIFETVATAKLGDVDLGVLAACSLGKIAVLVATWLVTYLAYKPWCSRGQRFLTATVFSFFAIASNDFAIGFPIVEALNGRDMDMGIYIAGNALVGSVFFVPLMFVLLTIGKSIQRGKADEESQLQATVSFKRQAIALLKDLIKNPVLVMTVVGLLFKLLFGFTLVDDGMKVHLPPPLSDIVKLVSSPFGMCALFITGASLANFEVAVWPVLLVVMKVILCAYATYFFAGFMISDGVNVDARRLLHNFSFLYGMLPTSTAPLIFAQQFAPDSIVEVATAIMLGLVVAGPMMFGAALFLEAATTDMASTLTAVMLTTTSASLVCGILFLAMLAAVWHVWDLACPSKTLILSYALSLMAYEAFMLAMNPHVRLASCRAYNTNQHSVISTLLGWAQNSSQLMIIVLQFLLAVRNVDQLELTSRKVSCAFISTCVLGGLLPAILTIPNTVTEMCSVAGDCQANISVWPNAIWVYCLLFTMCMIGLYDLIAHRKSKRLNTAASTSGCVSEENPDKQEAAVICTSAFSEHVVRGLTLMQIVRLLLRVVNTSEVLLGASITGSFAEMLVVEGVLEHLQLPILVVLMISDATFASDLSKRVQGLSYLMCKSSSEIDAAADERESPAHARLGRSATACSLGI
eukprot:TRINITY_DN5685_c0_g4_i1.p1 TRINITY_DN5685_c0_g4~~TRINITY_DN5685_c0_g4_i1.p1  ORF type:complete len:721 (-),score=112.20 TRINITY_DN5685_c0_g4_i1:267-2429(-)